ncbi:hypothetical protein MTO96_050625 [Rhipicephalus appendiculatus]
MQVSTVIKVFIVMVALRVLSKSDSCECGLAIAFGSLVWTLCPAVSALACIARNRFCCATTTDDPQQESHEDAAPEADARTESSVPRLPENWDFQPPLAVSVTDALPTNVGRHSKLNYTEDTTMDNVTDTSAFPVQAVHIDLNGLFFNLDVTKDGRFVVIMEGPLMQYASSLPTHIVFFCDDGTPLYATLFAAEEEVLPVVLRPPLYVTRPNVGDLDLESFTQLLLSYGMQLTKEAVLTRGDDSATARHIDVQLLHVVVRHV